MAMLLLHHVKVTGVILAGLRPERQEFRSAPVAVDEMGERTNGGFGPRRNAEAFLYPFISVEKARVTLLQPPALRRRDRYALPSPAVKPVSFVPALRSPKIRQFNLGQCNRPIRHRLPQCQV